MSIKSAGIITILGTGLAGFLLAAPRGGDADKGKSTFEDNCAVCHNVANDEKKMGPSLKGLFKRPTLKNGKKVTEANVLAVINAGGNGMPAYADMLNDDEKGNVLAYLKTL
jgi:mono/diheme cytochrome c family protein